MSKSIQHVKSKVRAPRVHITYDVETDGAIKMVSLPFKMGIVAALSGDRHNEKDPAKRLAPFQDRTFEEISTVNFDEVMKKAAPSLRFAVENKLEKGSDSKLKVDLSFDSLKDFEPEVIAQNLGPTKELLALRQKMHSLLTRLEGQSEADKLLREVIASSTNPRPAEAPGEAKAEE
ncbi:MAG TPA: type VI secretion system contractile sheath small subunit [Pseudomonadota bacterium]|nr:type VI secretion system contractile sheath small subunit [Pseudomonadota bacterium]